MRGVPAITPEMEKKAVEIAIGGGNPLQYLKECGAKNPSARWAYIKEKLMGSDPETYDKLPKRIARSEAKEPAVMMTVPAIVVHEQEPLFEVTAIRHKTYGEFYYDHDRNCIDWRNGLGDELSMGVEGWKKLNRDLPNILIALGVHLV